MRTASIRLPGSPDAACDIVAETIVDEYLRRDPDARIRLSVTGGRGALFVSGDVKSTADFDVASVVSRALGSAGVMADLEPFISLEAVVPEQDALFQQGSLLPVGVYGYATGESDDLIPTPVSLARRITKRLEDLRQHDDDWFWMGADGEITVQMDPSKTKISLLIEQGGRGLQEARRMVGEVVQSIAPHASIEINALGNNEIRGLANVMGASGRALSVYGDALPAVVGLVGTDPRDPRKAGAWLARAAARSLVLRGAKAAMVQCVYAAGEREPSSVRVRDEQGKDRSSEIRASDLSLDRVINEWWRPGLGVDAARWGFAGEPGLPWEQ